MLREIKDNFKRVFFRFYKFGTSLGIHVLPVHYYSPVPNILELERTKGIWARKSELPGISIDIDDQVENLRMICLPWMGEVLGNKIYLDGVMGGFGPGFGYIEAQALHAIIRHYKPKKIIEVGCGVSTYCMISASKKNTEEVNQTSKIICIEPYPSPKLNALSEIEMIPEKVQNVPIEPFERLEDGDLLFIDSSHTVKPGSDVNYLILEVIPRLKPGVVVHFHDIFLPYDYQRDVLSTFLHWTETSLLRAFLINNNKVKIIFCMSQLHYERKDILKEVFPEYTPQLDKNGLRDSKYRPFEQISQHFPSSLYIQTK
ncbi:MAG: class I SAM-dependent methyltransferase [Deltaproteobacteria bacterium]|nr:class I SAM-dependent methyltransferase [Deltaproteobacteria bacterium]